MRSETAMVVTLEEAEDLIPILRKLERLVTHLATYGAPVTRRMLHFNCLSFYTIPRLPSTWKAPGWFKNELGLLAGRLYFEFDEYGSIKSFFGLRGSDGFATEDRIDGTAKECAPQQDQVHLPVRSSTEAARSMAFLQDWLVVRRKGQEFTHTPIGFICENKALVAQHPFFSCILTEGLSKGVTDVSEASPVSPTSSLGSRGFSFSDDSEPSSSDELDSGH